jgi:general secretion pathway protein K
MRKNGSILVVALWTLFFLASIAIAIAAQVAGSINAAAKLKDDTISRYAAKAGMDRVIMEVLCDTNEFDGLNESWNDSPILFKDQLLDKGIYMVCSPVVIDRSGTVVTNYGVVSEEGRINLNKATKEQLRALIEKAAAVDTVMAAGIADCVLDWRDGDDEVLTAGAENGYYHAQKKPYTCRNGYLKSVEEFRLIKGVTDEIYRKTCSYVTVYGTGKINLNAAEPVVLKALMQSAGSDNAPAMDALTDKILSYRASGLRFSGANAAGIAGMLGAHAKLSPDEAAIFAGIMKDIAVKSTCFRGKAYGKPKSGKVWLSCIEFVFSRKENRIVYWRE